MAETRREQAEQLKAERAAALKKLQAQDDADRAAADKASCRFGHTNCTQTGH